MNADDIRTATDMTVANIRTELKRYERRGLRRGREFVDAHRDDYTDPEALAAAAFNHAMLDLFGGGA